MIVLLPQGKWRAGSACPLDEEEAHHLRVRRAESGAEVGVRDGAGLIGTGTLSRDGENWVVDVHRAESAPRLPVTMLAVGAGDRDRFGWVVEKASELGVGSVVPVETARTAGVATRLKAGHLGKLRRMARESVKQSGAAWATTVEDPIALDRFLAMAVGDARWLADRAGDPPPARLGREAVTVLVGPEGGLTDTERTAIVAAGFHPTRLGEHTLRFETAAIAAAAAVNAARLRGDDG